MKHVKIFEDFKSPQIQYINSLEDLKRAISNPYRIAEYLSDGTQLFMVDDDDNINRELIYSYDEENSLSYHINWEDDSLFTEDGTKIPTA